MGSVSRRVPSRSCLEHHAKPGHSMIYSSLNKTAFVSVALLAACYDSCASSSTANDVLNEPQISIETKYVNIFSEG
jgi:hypothetical protein